MAASGFLNVTRVRTSQRSRLARGARSAAGASPRKRAGVRVFATGGLGGVHRGGEASLDVSADLPALARAAGTVTVCAGVKSILDIPRTLEASGPTVNRRVRQSYRSVAYTRQERFRKAYGRRARNLICQGSVP